VRLTLQVVRGAPPGRRCALEKGELTLGRGDDQDLPLGLGHVSTEHGKVVRTRRGFVYRDLFSTNGSAVLREGVRHRVDAAGERQEMVLRDGDELLLGQAEEPVVVAVRIEEEDEARDIRAVRRLTEVPELEAGLARDHAHLRRLHEATTHIARVIDLDEALAATAEAVFDLLPSTTHLGIFLKEEEGFVPHLGRAGRERAEEPTLSRTLARRVLREQAGVLASNAAEELSTAASIMAADIMSTLCVPLWKGEEIYGLLQVDNRTAAGTFGESHLELLTVLATQVSHAVRNALLYRRLEAAEAAARKENRYLKSRERARGGIIGESPAWKRVMDQVAKVQATRVPVCITGETGTGKEVVARAIHYGSGRAERLFVAQNMAAMPESILESELFGHRRGAFTGAEADKKGLFEIADGGTIFLDEITEMSPALQAKLLRVLQEGEIRPVGESHPRPVDVRVLSATNRDPDKAVRDGTFRQDLYYRLMVFPIRLPPLRERVGDVRRLVEHFLDRCERDLGRPAPPLSEVAMSALERYRWPGNIRELENEVQRIVIQGVEGDQVEPHHLSPAVTGSPGTAPDLPALTGSLKEMMASVERSLLDRTLEAHGGNKTRAAKALGITREGLHKKLAKLRAR